tara:strand:- start:395 stop:580 length:186 start_codon:yes stop_codon:yes gene_type:complete
MSSKKIGGAAAAAIGALLYGGAQLLDHETRIQALEDAAEPEEEAEEKPEEEPQVTEEPVEE